MSEALEIVQKFNQDMTRISEATPETIPTLGSFMGTAARDEALTYREMELVAIGAALYTQCPECIVVHCQKAVETGCTWKRSSRRPARRWSSTAVLPASSATLPAACLDTFCQ